jgi:hypothetical protein
MNTPPAPMTPALPPVGWIPLTRIYIDERPDIDWEDVKDIILPPTPIGGRVFQYETHETLHSH